MPLAITAAWVASLFLPVATVDPSRPDAAWSGWFVLLLGPIGIVEGQYGWFANIFLLAGLVATMVERRPPIPVLLALAGLLVAASFNVRTWERLPVTGGGASPIKEFGAGFHLWRACVMSAATWFLLLAAAFLVGDRTRRRA